MSILAKHAREMSELNIRSKKENLDQYKEIKERILKATKEGEFNIIHIGPLFVNVIKMLEREGYNVERFPNELMGIEFNISF